VRAEVCERLAFLGLKLGAHIVVVSFREDIESARGVRSALAIWPEQATSLSDLNRFCLLQALLARSA
jgi:hypothetical protein